MDDWIIIITAGNQQLKSIFECKNLGLKIFSVDENPYAIGFKFSDLHYVQDISHTENIIKEINRKGIIPIGVASFVSDVGILPAAKIRSYYNLDGLDEEKAEIHTNKKKQKYLCEKYNIAIPPYVAINDLENFPMYVQQWGDFEHHVSILDMFFNLGDDTVKYFNWG